MGRRVPVPSEAIRTQTSVRSKPQYPSKADLTLPTKVFDENRLTRDDFLGRVELPLVSLPREAEGRPTGIPNKYYILQPRSARSKVSVGR